VWEGLAWVDVPPSPKSHAKLTAFSEQDELKSAEIPAIIPVGAVKQAFGAFGVGSLLSHDTNAVIKKKMDNLIICFICNYF
jgi:hypothetical protein